VADNRGDKPVFDFSLTFTLTSAYNLVHIQIERKKMLNFFHFCKKTAGKQVIFSIQIVTFLLVIFACSPAIRYARPDRTTVKSIENRGSSSLVKIEPNQLSDNALSTSGNENLTSTVQKYMGIPYKWGGEDISGMDCSGFTRCVFRDLAGLNLPHSAKGQYGLGSAVPAENLRAGDLVFFKINRFTISHVGIYLGNGTFAHASRSEGVTITDFADEYYQRTYRGAKRLL
jgi:cell wall-associated NlpC family hydrolase